MTTDSSNLRSGSSAKLAAALRIGVILIGLFPLVLAALIGAFSIDPGVAVVPLLGFCIYLIIVTYCARVLRRRRAAAILHYLRDAARMNLPLSQWLGAAIQTENFALRDRLVALRDSLEGGSGLSDALDQHVPEVPARVVRALAAAENIGRLPSELSRLARRPVDGLFDNPILVVYRIYPLALIAVAMFPVIFVFSKYLGIMKDFHVQSPWALQWVIAIAYSLPVQISVALVIGLFVLSTLFSTARLFAGRRVSMPFFAALADSLIWPLPIAGSLARDRGLAELCAFLADAIEAGRPLNESLLQAAGAQPNTVLARRIRAWARAVSSGRTIADTARSARMPSILVSMLATSANSENLVQTLQFLSRHFDLRVARTRAILQSVAVPVSVFIMGAAVALLALSLFQPLVALIDATMKKPFGGF